MSYRFTGEKFRLGILGGGQLGRMLIQEAINLNISTAVLDPDPDAPCRHLTEIFQTGDFKNEETVLEFGSDLDMITVEIEHVNIEALIKLQAKGIAVYPQPHILAMIQDKGSQKNFYAEHNIPTAEFVLVESKDELKQYHSMFPAVQKMRRSGYDGKGVQILNDVNDLSKAFDVPSVLEKKVPFVMEIAVIVSRNAAGDIAHFPAVEMEFSAQANLVEFLCSPARIKPEVEQEAVRIASLIIEKAGMIGLLAVEMFVLQDGSILVNEIAPRPHNSGHHTIEGNVTSQYQQHLRAILNLPPGDTSIVRPAVMINLLGEEGFTGDARYENLDDVLRIPGAYVHLYGKKKTKPFRKMGHVTVTASALDEAIVLARYVQRTLKVKA